MFWFAHHLEWAAFNWLVSCREKQWRTVVTHLLWHCSYVIRLHRLLIFYSQFESVSSISLSDWVEERNQFHISETRIIPKTKGLVNVFVFNIVIIIFFFLNLLLGKKKVKFPHLHRLIILDLFVLLCHTFTNAQPTWAYMITLDKSWLSDLVNKNKKCGSFKTPEFIHSSTRSS